MTLLVGVDVGTTNVKAAAFTPSGACAAVASVPTPVSSPRPGWTEHDPGALWDTVCGALSRVTAAIDPGDVAGVAVASMGEAGVPLDRDGRPTYPVIAWFDPRTAEQVDALTAAVGRQRLVAITGTRPQAIHGVCKLMWLDAHEPQALREAVRWLNVADYVAHRLGARPVTDRSLASRTLAYELGAGEWSDEILAAAQVDARLLAPLVWSGSHIGEVGAAASRQTGLPEGTPIAAGGHDHVCGALAAGVVTPGDLLDSMGTAESYLVALDAPLPGAGPAAAGLGQGAHVAAGRHYLAGGLHAAGASLRWVLDAVGGGRRHEDLLAAAEDVAPERHRVVFVPHLRGAGPPYSGHGASGAFVGLGADADAAVLVRAVLDGLAFAFRAAVDAVEDAAGNGPAAEVVAIGGGNRSDLLVRLKATLVGRPVTVLDVEEEVALGAGLLGGVAAGVFADSEAAAGSVDVPARTVEPDEALRELYEERYRDLYVPAARATVSLP